MTELYRTPLYDVYKNYGAKTIDFGGWDLPVQFSSIKEEHEAVRTKAGLFDVSHMGEVEVRGEDSLAFLQKIATNDVSLLKNGGAQYTAMCYEDGGTVDDLLIYKKADHNYLLVINASNIEKDVDWLTANTFGDVSIKNVSNDLALLALQGPFAEKVLQTLTDIDLSEIKFFKFRDEINIAGVKALVSRTGYTGEDGFELYCAANDAVTLWGKILETGKEDGVLPCGLGARDTLRFEATLPLYGQELTKDITPIEAGIGFAVKPNKEADFNGKAVLKDQKENGAARKLVGIELIEKGIPRHGYEVFVNGEEVGVVTTGTQSPTLGKNIGLALLKTEFTELGTEVEVQVRKKRLKAVVVATPFYKRPKN
ncbi:MULTISPECIES: glycine cleavage system aminomethyltransferase GcvT [Bacillaceae]|uniref:glycine cleavage system aminomethyltransferase GcvT n=1 Tax=Bacillaceae TaxID=186817 RepID=UPI000BFE172E|nr:MULTISPECIES: glycine cleavage system aminomethyltransferase GcvT [Bacillaceae]PGT87611.1 glycine cleavage system protein T [Bacillus sp. AFS040349]UGB29466.1 glycine cleavage system aminomethyltransferase GcvT [Metabacillus sp. B2-18]